MQLTYQQQSKIAWQVQRKDVSITFTLNFALKQNRKKWHVDDCLMSTNKEKFYIALLTPCLVEATADDSASVYHYSTTGRNLIVYTCDWNVYSDNVMVNGAWPNCTFVNRMQQVMCVMFPTILYIPCHWLLKLQCSIP